MRREWLKQLCDELYFVELENYVLKGENLHLRVHSRSKIVRQTMQHNKPTSRM
jgi:hypothetical protein